MIFSLALSIAGAYKERTFDDRWKTDDDIKHINRLNKTDIELIEKKTKRDIFLAFLYLIAFVVTAIAIFMSIRCQLAEKSVSENCMHPRECDASLIPITKTKLGVHIAFYVIAAFFFPEIYILQQLIRKFIINEPGYCGNFDSFTLVKKTKKLPI